MSKELHRLPIRSIWVDALSMEQALACVTDFLDQESGLHTVFASNPEKTFSVPRDPVLYEAFRKADLIIPDGIGMVLAARLLHGAKLRRIPGCELMEQICALAAAKGVGIFLYGAKEEVNAGAAGTLESKYPGLKVAGRSHGYRPESDMDALVKEINDSGAGVLFLALGSPRQEQWLATYGPRLHHVRVCQGIGGTLDVITGTVKRAPRLWCRLGLEWMYRLLSDPRRWKRQRVLPIFAWQVVCDRFGVGRSRPVRHG